MHPLAKTLILCAFTAIILPIFAAGFTFYGQYWQPYPLEWRGYNGDSALPEAQGIAFDDIGGDYIPKHHTALRRP